MRRCWLKKWGFPSTVAAAGSTFKLEKAQPALAQLGYRDIWDRWMLQAVPVKDKPADKSGSEGLMLLQRGKAKDADEAS